MVVAVVDGNDVDDDGPEPVRPSRRGPLRENPTPPPPPVPPVPLRYMTMFCVRVYVSDGSLC